MFNFLNFLILIFILSFIIKGCAPLPKEFQEIPLDKKVGFSQILESPQEYKGTNVLWGGKIVNCLNQEDFTILEIVQFPLDIESKPKIDTFSEGRFQVKTSKFLDCAIYHPGRLITVAGTFRELKEGKIGEKSYKFPLIEGKAFKLWREELRIQLETPIYTRCYWGPPYWWPWWYYPCW